MLPILYDLRTLSLSLSPKFRIGMKLCVFERISSFDRTSNRKDKQNEWKKIEIYAEISLRCHSKMYFSAVLFISLRINLWIALVAVKSDQGSLALAFYCNVIIITIWNKNKAQA